MKKPWYKSKGIVSGVALIAGSLYFFSQGQLADAYQMFFQGSGIIGVRHAIGKLSFL